MRDQTLEKVSKTKAQNFKTKSKSERETDRNLT